MVNLQHTVKAVKDLSGIYSFISQDSDLYAKTFIAALRQTSILKKYPELGRPFYREKYENLRQVTYKPYRIVYHFDGSKVIIITIHHQTKLPENIVELQDYKK